MKRKVVDVLLITLVFTACVVKVAPISGQNKENTIQNNTNKENTKENTDKNNIKQTKNADKRGISSVIENALEEQQELNKVKRTEITKDTNVVGNGAVKKKKIQKEGWTTANLNIRESPSTDANILDVLPFNTYIKYYGYNDGWAEIAYDDGQAYVSLDYIGDEECEFVMYNVPKTKGFKSYMPYTAITDKSSKQYKLQQIASTGTYGIRTVNGRFLCAIGTAFNAEVGTYIDLILEDGFVISCIVGDVKSPRHTDSSNMITMHNGCVSEFIINSKALHKSIKKSGDVSSCNDNWNGCVRAIVVYSKSAL